MLQFVCRITWKRWKCVETRVKRCSVGGMISRKGAVIAFGVIVAASVVCIAWMVFSVQRANRERDDRIAAETRQIPRAQNRAETQASAENSDNPHAEREALARLMSQTAEQNQLAFRFRSRGVWLDVLTPNCNRATIVSIVSANVVLEPLLRTEYRFASCADTDETIEVRLPPVDVPVPPSVEWNRSYVATPANRGRSADHPPLWCTDTSPISSSAMCARAREACVAREQSARGLFQNDPTMRVIPCAETQTLWCCDTTGTERVCFLNREQCNEAQARHCGTSRCERRWVY